MGSSDSRCQGTLPDDRPCPDRALYRCKPCGAQVCYECATSWPAFSMWDYPLWDAGCPLCRSTSPEFVPPYDPCEAYSGPEHGEF